MNKDLLYQFSVWILFGGIVGTIFTALGAFFLRHKRKKPAAHIVMIILIAGTALVGISMIVMSCIIHCR